MAAISKCQKLLQAETLELQHKDAFTANAIELLYHIFPKAEINITKSESEPSTYTASININEKQFIGIGNYCTTIWNIIHGLCKKYISVAYTGNSEILSKKEVAKEVLSALCNISFGAQVQVATDIVKPTAQQQFAAEISK